jgi:HD-GYP domain-containing protein (c-di-GMP phosphodiesterase class II)
MDSRPKHEIEALHNQTEGLAASRTQQWEEALADLKRSYDLTLEALGGTLDLKDAQTQGHCNRVTAYTIAIAQKMGLPKEEIMSVIARGAFLHEIGLMAIPDNILILRKPDKLNDEEFGKMREHSYLGYTILRNIPFLAEAAEIVYAHHERYDGTGYPRGLKGDEIPLGARIVSIADTLDAMTSDRPYRPAHTFEAARKEIEESSGRKFDPQIVRVFLEMPANTWEDFRKEVVKASH